MDSSNSLMDSPFGSLAGEPCRVCNEPTGTYHYGSICCSGCKGFFRRSVRYNKVYQCANQNQCVIQGEYRNCCRACRFNKCLGKGLNPLLVHGDRGVTAHRHQGLAKVKMERLSESPPEQPYSLIPVKSEMIGIDANVIERIIHEGKFLQHDKNAPLGAFNMIPHKDFSNFSSVAEYYLYVERLCDNYIDIEIPHLTVEFDNYCTINVPQDLGVREPRLVSRRSKVDWTPRFYTTAKFFYQGWCRSYLTYIDWASHIPELRQLTEKDQEVLMLGRAVSSILLLFGRRALTFGTPGIPLTGGSYFPTNQAEWSQIDKEMVMIMGQLTNTLMTEYVVPMKEVNMTEAEYALLRVISFFMTEASLSSEGMSLVKKFRNKYLDNYSDLIRSTHPELSTIDIIKKMSKTMLILAAIEKAAQASDETIAMMTLFNMAGLRGTFTYDFYVRRKDPFAGQATTCPINKMNLL